jgi:hypothetical protein
VIFVFPILTPANTPSSNKLPTSLPLAVGKVTQVSVQFPPGVCGLAAMQISQGLHQLWPTNPEASFGTSEETIIFDEDIDLELGDTTLTAYTWNVDDSYDHTLTVRIVVATLEEQTSWLDEAKKLLGMGGA